MKYINYLLLGLFFIAMGQNRLSAQNQLSANAEISVLTCAPSDNIYSAFGHSAIRVKDLTTYTDIVFNYGTFNFNTPNFYIKFAQGKLDYMLSVSNFGPYIEGYKRENRSVSEQVLNLTIEQKQSIINYLINNAKQESKFYRYDFFFDNCATRVYEVINKGTNGKVKFSPPQFSEYKTFRTMLQHYISNKEWLSLGINLIIGMPADKKVSTAEASFLPDYLENIIANSTIMNDGKELPFVKAQNIIFEAKEISSNSNFFSSPAFVLGSLLFIIFVVLILEIYGNRNFIILRQIIFLIYGLAGLLFTLMWALTDHDAVVNNLNIIWASPLNIFVAFFLNSKKLEKIITKYLIIYIITLIIFIIFFFLKRSFFDFNLLPILLIILLVSSNSVFKHVRKSAFWQFL